MNNDGNRSGSVSAAAVLAVAMVLGVLVGCGQKGPLFLPGAPGVTPMSASTPSPGRAATAQPGPASSPSR